MTNEEKLLPDVIWVAEHEDENTSCDYVADKNKCIFTKSDNAVKYLRAEIAEELVEALKRVISEDETPLFRCNMETGEKERRAGLTPKDIASKALKAFGEVV